MTRRIALVDIDGCLLQEGKLNAELIERLKGYDEVILFTQRSKLVQKTNINAAFYLAGPGNAQAESKTTEPLIITPDIAAALEKILKKPIRVSTSLDHLIGQRKPLEYADQVGDFERRFLEVLKKEDSKKTDARDDTFDAELEREVQSVRNGVGADSKMQPQQVYPMGKVEQYVALASLWKDCSVDYYDDNNKNLDEILAAAAQSRLRIIPNCILVEKHRMVPHETISPERQEAASAFIVYIKSRQNEEKQNQKKIGKGISKLFTPEKRTGAVKISAAEKCVLRLAGKPVDFTRAELESLHIKGDRLNKEYEAYQDLLNLPTQAAAPKAKK